MQSLREIKTEQAWKECTSNIDPETLQIIYFKTEWAAPCKRMTTVIETLANSYPVNEPPATSWIIIDAEELIDISDSFNVSAVPFIVLRRGTEVIETVSGSDVLKVRAVIEKNINSPTPIAQPVKSNQVESKQVEAKDLDTNKSSSQDAVTMPEDSVGEDKQNEKLHERLAALVKAAPVMLFMKGTPGLPRCGFSREIVGILRKSGIKYGFFDILADDDVREGLKTFADWPTYPQLWINGELVGGLDIVKEELANNPDFLKSSGSLIETN
ncbi:hypothetical protein Golomagni_00329 [Golovinomyces magnicellulatus]|nr:hypothetical protein Golomagni_00329 [Golovinomyces magnicellulatus]